MRAKQSQHLLSSDNFIAYPDPVAPATKGHTIISPKKDIRFEDLTPENVAEMYGLATKVMQSLKDEYGATGFNIGMDIGASAGQIINCVSWHVIPRYEDGCSVRGGMRYVAPAKPNPGIGTYREDWHF